jgi:creatinine amidohydrolase/Fe(II)-dependent formamide hydrolase-like protein
VRLKKDIVMQLHLSSWPEIEDYLTRSRGIVIPIGSTEQHGPTGLIGTDAICPEVIAKRAADEAGFLVGPTFNVGVAQHHLGFPGSMTLRPSTMIAAIHDWVASLGRHGFERIYFFNGHGGNVSTINAAFSEIYADRSLSADASNRGPVKCRLANWWDYRPVMDFCRERYGASHGSHATPSEVAVTYFAYPDAIKTAELNPKIAPTGRFTDAEDYRAKFPDGRIGSDPSLADPKDGEKLVALSAAGLIEDYAKFLAA